MQFNENLDSIRGRVCRGELYLLNFDMTHFTIDSCLSVKLVEIPLLDFLSCMKDEA